MSDVPRLESGRQSQGQPASRDETGGVIAQATEIGKLISESPPFKLYATLAAIVSPIYFLVNSAIGVWHFLTVPIRANAPIVVITEGIIAGISGCGALGLGILAPVLARRLFGSRKRVSGWDWFFGVPLSIALLFYLWDYAYGHVPYAMIFTLTFGVGCFLMLVILPAFGE
jgi:hypothetical protein